MMRKENAFILLTVIYIYIYIPSSQALQKQETVPNPIVNASNYIFSKDFLRFFCFFRIV
jgi:hypothetical protein